MNKQGLIDAVAAKANISKADAKNAIEAVLESIEIAMKADDSLSLVGFGSFSVVSKAARQGKNPRTGEIVEIPARKVVKFKPGSSLKL